MLNPERARIGGDHSSHSMHGEDEERVPAYDAQLRPPWFDHDHGISHMRRRPDNVDRRAIDQRSWPCTDVQSILNLHCLGSSRFALVCLLVHQLFDFQR